MQKIKLYPEALKASKFKGPSDERLLNWLQRSMEDDKPPQKVLKWICYQILKSNGMQFEE